MKFSGVKILQGVEISIFLLIFEWALQQCSATALPVICNRLTTNVAMMIMMTIMIIAEPIEAL